MSYENITVVNHKSQIAGKYLPNVSLPPVIKLEKKKGMCAGSLPNTVSRFTRCDRLSEGYLARALAETMLSIVFLSSLAPLLSTSVPLRRRAPSKRGARRQWPGRYRIGPKVPLKIIARTTRAVKHLAIT